MFVYVQAFPDEEVPTFKKSVLEVFHIMTVLQSRVLHVIAHSLGLEVSLFFILFYYLFFNSSGYELTGIC